MNKITFPLKQPMQSAAVRDLQDALLLLLGKGVLLPNDETSQQRLATRIRPEQEEQLFGRTTAEAILIFQREQDLQASGEVDESTAVALNRFLSEFGLLDEQEYSVSGKVAISDGTGVPGLVVRAYDQCLGKENQLGNDRTDTDGNYSLIYQEKDLINPAGKQPNLRVRVYSRRDTLEATSPLIINALPQEVVNLALGEEAYLGPDLYSRLHQTLAEYLEGIALDGIEPRDLYCLANNTEMDIELVHHYVLARQWQQQWDGLSPEVFFAWFRKGLPREWGVLLSRNLDELKSSIQNAVEENIASKEALSFLETLEIILIEWRSQYVITSNNSPLTQASLGQLLQVSALSSDQSKQLLQQWQTFDGQVSDFWAAQEEQLGETVNQDLDLTLKLGALTRNHLPLIKHLKDRPTIQRFTDIAGFAIEDWLQLFDETALEMPPELKGDDIASQKYAYAEALTRFTEQMLPTRVMIQAFSKDSDVDSQEIESFFEQNPDFEFRSQSIRSYIEKNPLSPTIFPDPKATQSELEAMQRIFHLSPATNRYAVAKILWQNNLHSAWAITLQGEQELLDLFEGELIMAKRVFDKAQSAQQVSHAAMLQYMDYKYSFGYAFPKDDKQIEGIPDLESLFGGQGYCECKHCTSYFSPSAYLVDLFLYLKKAKLSSGAASPPVDTALEKLFERRPDLANLELNCENANTVLPYIDLVNEVLENAIIPRDYDYDDIKVVNKTFTLPFAKDSEPVPQTEADPDTLRAFPQHLNPLAYERLQTGDQQQGLVYPWSLPFNLWLIEVRSFLQHLKVPRWLLMESILGQQNNAVDIASEYLGLSIAEKSIQLDANPNNQQLDQYWGISGALAKLVKVETMLKHSGFSYKQLQQLLTLRFIQSTNRTQRLEIKFDPVSSCQLADAQLENLNETALSRIHRLGRLQLKTQEELIVIDQTLMALGTNINDDFLQDYAYLKRIEQALPRKMKRRDVLCWWSQIDTHNYPEEESLYGSLFLNPSLNQPAEAEFELNNTLTELKKVSENQATVLDLSNPGLDPDLQTLILATLRWSMSELISVVNDEWNSASFELNLANLSYLYRVSSFCRALRLKVNEFLTLKAVSGTNPLPSSNQIRTIHPKQTYVFIQLQQLVKNVGLDPELLDYLLRHQYREDATFALGADEIKQILLDLQNQLSKALNETRPEGMTLWEGLEIKLSQILLTEEIVSVRQILEKDLNLNWSVQEKKDFLEEKLPIFPDLAEAKTKLIDGGLVEQSERYLYVLEALESYLIENTLVQQLAESLSLSTELADSLLRTYLVHPSDSSLSAIQVFLTPGFITPAENSEFTEEYFSDQVSTVIRLQKIGLLSANLGLQTESIIYLLKYGLAAGLPDLSQLAIQEVVNELAPGMFDSWELLMELVRINRDQFNSNSSVFDILAYPLVLENNQAGLFELLNRATQWELNDLTFLSSASGLNLSYPLDYQTGDWLLAMANTMALVNKVGISAQQISQWTSLDITQAQASAVRHAVKAKYGNKQWLDITSPIRNQIRKEQRDALLSFVLHHRKKQNQQAFEDVDDLYAYYLVDPQMSACTNTSRTVLASSSVQLFMQRILLNLEPGITISREHAEEWQWRKYYRIWEANRKVFIWPENWIEPELRDNKSPFFQELENELLQDELKEETVERAYVNYLHKLHEVAHLEISAVHYEDEVGTLHIFARTTGNPPVYYYRRWEKRREWTPWEKMELEIYNAEGVETPQTGVLLIPVVHNRRLFLFWPIFTLQRDEPDENAKDSIKDHKVIIADIEEHIRIWENVAYDSSIHTHLILDAKEKIRVNEESIKKLEAGKAYYSIKMAYSDYRQGHWTAKKLTNNSVRSPHFESKFKHADDLHRYFFIPKKSDDGELRIRWYYSYKTTYYKFRSYFKFDSCSNKLKYERGGIFQKPYYKGKKDLIDPMWYMKAKDDSNAPYPLRVINTAKEVNVLLNTAKEHHLLSFSLDHGVFKNTTPFFYEDEDNKRTFFVVPPVPRKWADVNSAIISSQVMSAKSYSMSAHAYEDAIISTAEEQLVENRVEVISSNSNAKKFYQASQSKHVMIRKGGISPEAGQITANADLIDNLASTDIFTEATAPPDGVSTSTLQFFTFGEYVFRIFYHPYTCLFLKQLNRYGIKGLLNPNPSTKDGKALSRQATPDHDEVFDFGDTYNPNWNEVNPFKQPREIITFDYDDAYANYNWELFFHIPMLIATRLHQDQRFETAQQWYHYIFDPTETQGDAPYRFWKIKPFHKYSSAQMKSDMKLLLQGKLKSQIQAWQENPFSPHLLARFRRIAYMKTTIMKYLDNLIAWGDQLFRRDSIESLNEATQLYVLAGQILGKLPVATEAKNVEVKTFSQLAQSLDTLGNGWVEIQLSQQDQDSDNGNADSSNGNPDLIPYFCFPPNEKLLAYWDTVADRLFKIRHCMNIEGVVRQLPLFQPPIDPALLVRAAASGMDLSSAVNDLFAPLPKYRFSVMIQKAQEICQDLKSLGGNLLSVLEKKDVEALSLLRSQHETALFKANRDIRKNQLEESKINLEALNEQREISTIKFENYRDRDFMNATEVIAFALARSAGITKAISAGIAAAGGAAHQAPDGYAGTLAGPMGGGIGLARISGGDKVGKGITSASKWVDLAAIILQDLAEASATMGSYQRRQEDWILQRDLAYQEIKQIEQQALASEIRIAIAEKEKENLELQISQSQTVDEFMKNKYTQQQLYGWMVGQIATVYFQTYQLAYDIAKQAEKTFRHELGIDQSNYIQFGYWDNLRKGLLSGEKLSLDLKRLEMAYLEKNRREFEISKHVSLALLDPLALIKLRETGRCNINLPEEVFDLDYPGHYFRRIKSVSLTLPCIVGPYTTVSCTLRLLKNSIRINTGNGDNGYPRNMTEQGLFADDARFIENNIPVKAIATSNAQNDSGIFELSFRDERYLPFEGAGVISQWSLEMFNDASSEDFGKSLRQFDYNTISDAILHISYTAREDVGGFKTGAVENLRQYFSQDDASPSIILFDLKHQFATQWHKFLYPTNPLDGNVFELEMSADLFSLRDKGKILKVNSIWLFARCSNTSSYGVVMTPPLSEPPPVNNNSFELVTGGQYGELHMAQKDTNTIGVEVVTTDPALIWQLTMTRPGGGNLQKDQDTKSMEVEELILVLGYEWD